MISNKLKTNHTYLATTNYWAPLQDKSEEIEEPEQINIIEAKQSTTNTNSNKWTCWIVRRRAMTLVIDSGAMSNFVPEEVKEYDTFQGVVQATKDIILEAVDTSTYSRLKTRSLDS